MKLPARLGRRGSALLVLGLIWVLRGAGVLTTRDRVGPPPPYLHEQLTHGPLSAIWMTTGALALLAAWRTHPGKDAFGFAALVVPPILHVVSYAWGWLTLVTRHGEGSASSLSSALIWLSIVALILIIAGWAEAPDGYAPPKERP